MCPLTAPEGTVLDPSPGGRGGRGENGEWAGLGERMLARQHPLMTKAPDSEESGAKVSYLNGQALASISYKYRG